MPVHRPRGSFLRGAEPQPPRARRWGSRAATAGLAALVLAACTLAHPPDLARIYRDQASRRERRPPLVGLPGLIGTRIEDPSSHEVLWGGLSSLVRRKAPMRLALPVRPGDRSGLEPVAPIRSLAGMDVYGGITRTLITCGGYRFSTLEEAAGPAPLLEFPYDWRLGCEENAARLAEFLASLRRLCKDPGLKVDLVGHSMGGLIARYYLLYGGADVLAEPAARPTFAGAEQVRRLVMFGTPNAGSAEALLALVHGFRLGLAWVPPDLLATMPSMVELMPPPGDPVLYHPDGTPAALDIHAPSTWKDQRWGVFDPDLEPGILKRYRDLHTGSSDRDARIYLEDLRENFARLLARAANFHRALRAAPAPAWVPTLLLGGNCERTLRGMVVEEERGRWVVRPRPGDVRRPVPGVDLERIYFGFGDGNVTRESLLGEGPVPPSASPLPHAVVGFICADHKDLVKNWTFQDNLLHFLLHDPGNAAQ